MHAHTNRHALYKQSGPTVISTLMEYRKTHSSANLEVIYGLRREMGLAGGCWLPSPQNIN